MSIVKFKLPFPPSVNAKYNMHGRKRVKSQKDKDWQDLANQWINKQNILPFTGRCFIVYELFYPDNRERDAANYEKKVTDLLVSRGILSGDDRRYVKGIATIWNDKPGDYIIVKIMSVDDVDYNLSCFLD